MSFYPAEKPKIEYKTGNWNKLMPVPFIISGLASEFIQAGL